MFFYKGQSCPVCGKPFAETDDIVTCPVCGAPHHRTCWQQDGHCHFESTHGTPQQWSRNSANSTPAESTASHNLCPHCGAPNVQYAEFCGRCGRDLDTSEWHSATQNVANNGTHFHEYSPFRPAYDPMGGVDHSELFDDDITAEDLAVSVGSNTPYYLPRFRKIRDGHAVQWNWMAFFLAPFWLLYRKQYVVGALVNLFYLAYFALNYTVFYLSGAGDIMFYDVYAAFEKSQQAGYFPVLFLLTIALLLIHLTCGLFANQMYYNLCRKRVRTAKETDPAEFRTQLQSTGGVSFVWGAVSYFTLNFLLSMIQLIFQMI